MNARRPRIPWSASLYRRTIAVIASLVLISSVSVLVASPSQALGTGTGCMFYAPTGASGFGHVGWGFSVGSANQWIYGATEFGDGAANSTWIHSGTQSQMFGDFHNAVRQGGIVLHDPGYYTEWRCRTISQTSVGAAQRAANDTKYNGYTIMTNDCLSKAMGILEVYGESLDTRALYVTPANYFVSGLNHSGFGPVHHL